MCRIYFNLADQAPSASPPLDPAYDLFGVQLRVGLPGESPEYGLWVEEMVKAFTACLPPNASSPIILLSGYTYKIGLDADNKLKVRLRPATPGGCITISLGGA